MRELLAVRPVARHRDVGIGHGVNPRAYWDIVALEAVRVALAVEPLMVCKHNDCSVAEVEDIRQDRGTEFRVASHLNPLRLTQFTFLG